MKTRILSATLAVIMALGVLLVPAARPAEASRKSEKTWRYLTYGGAALGAYGFLSGHKTLGWLGAGAAGYGYYRWHKDTRNRHHRQARYRTRYYRHRYYRHR